MNAEVRTIPLFLLGLSIALLTVGCTPKNYGDSSFDLRLAARGKDVMWMPTKVDMAHEMLAAAAVTNKDVIYDLGSGDGVIPIEAAKKFGVRAVGIEYNPDLVALSNRNAARANVQQLVTFKRGDIFVEDFTEATVLTLYLGENLNAKLMPKILRMRPGTRVVSNTFRMEAWIPDKEIRMASGDQAYLWIVPASLDGEWQIEGLPGLMQAKMSVRQKKQFFDGRIESKGQKYLYFEDGRIKGDQIEFEIVDHQKKRYRFTGLVRGAELLGSLNEDSALRVSGRRISR